jgi:hypothetical protein
MLERGTLILLRPPDRVRRLDWRKRKVDFRSAWQSTVLMKPRVSDEPSGPFSRRRGNLLRRLGSADVMPTLAQVYEQHSEECIRSAAKTDDPKQRALMLKLAGEWREDANALLRVAESAPSGASAPVRRNKR